MQCMLAGKCEDPSELRFPVLASVKLDGVRCIVLGGKLLSRNLKPIKNSLVQERFAGLPEGTDGELIVGDPTAKDAFRRTVSAQAKDGASIDDMRFYVFDNFALDHTGKMDMGFADRVLSLKLLHALPAHRNDFVTILENKLIRNAADLAAFEEESVSAGHEGVMVRHPMGPYKHGRSSTNEGWLLKIKRFADGEATVLGFEELMHNGNEATTNALGHTERSSHKANLKGLKTLGALLVVGVGGDYDGVEFKIGTGFDAETRKKIWDASSTYRGQLAKYKYFPLGSKDKPRFPVFLGWRDKDDL